MAKNSFLSSVTKCNTRTENVALSNSSTGDRLVDQFGKSGAYRGRSFEEVFADQSALWGENPLNALKLPFYLRMVTRKAKTYDGKSTETVQKGQGNKDESFKRLLWIASYHPDSFYKNLWLLPIVGSWKDLWYLLYLDRDTNVLDKKKIFQVIAEGIDDDYQCDLVKKYLPRIRSTKSPRCKSDWEVTTNSLAKEFCRFIGWNAATYRKFKSTGKAHEFQKIICAGLYKDLNFNTIPGKALTSLVSKDFLDRHNLVDKYVKWLETQPVAKFTGYPYELGKVLSDCRSYNGLKLPLYRKMTIDKQFEALLEKASKDQGGITGNVWCALDTSGSMGTKVVGDISAFDICISLGIYFSSLNKGAFHKNVIMFDDTSHVKSLSGTFSDMYNQIISESTAWGSTNFQSVIDEICRIRRTNPTVPLEDYPTTLLVVSDMQFNPSNRWDRSSSSSEEQTNYQTAMSKLSSCFPKEFVDKFRIIWWDCVGRCKDFPSTIDDKGTYVMSGFDGAIVTLLLGEAEVDEETGEVKQLSMQEMVDKALSQELLTFLSV